MFLNKNPTLWLILRRFYRFGDGFEYFGYFLIVGLLKNRRQLYITTIRKRVVYLQKLPTKKISS